ncbi:MAG: hypothetical protein ABI672_19930 [Vicinamibacteria bacterium]
MVTSRGALFAVLTASVYGAAFLGLVTEMPIKAEADQRFPQGSSLRRARGGSALAAQYLKARGHRVDALLNQDLTTLSSKSVVFVLQPPSHGTLEARPLLTSAEERFLRRGGRIVLTLDGPIASIDARPAPASSSWIRAHPLLPDGALRGTLRTYEIAGPWMNDAHALFLSSQKVVAARRVYGEGDLIAIGAPEAFSNERIAAGETLGWLDTLSHDRDVYFDETVHGLFERKGVLDLLSDWGLLPAVAALLLLAIAWVLRAARPFGPPERLSHVDYADGVNLVEALGLLYSRSVSEEEALARYAQPPRTTTRQQPIARPVIARGPSASAKPLPDRLREINQSKRSSNTRARSL